MIRDKMISELRSEIYALEQQGGELYMEAQEKKAKLKELLLPIYTDCKDKCYVCHVGKKPYYARVMDVIEDDLKFTIEDFGWEVDGFGGQAMVYHQRRRSPHAIPEASFEEISLGRYLTEKEKFLRHISVDVLKGEQDV